MNCWIMSLLVPLNVLFSEERPPVPVVLVGARIRASLTNRHHEAARGKKLLLELEDDPRPVPVELGWLPITLNNATKCSSDLFHQAQQIRRYHFLYEFSICDATDADAGCCDLFAGRCDAIQLALMRAGERPLRCHLVALGDHVVDGQMQIGKRAAPGGGGLLRARYAVQFIRGKRFGPHPVGCCDELLGECEVALIPILFDKAAHEGFVVFGDCCCS